MKRTLSFVIVFALLLTYVTSVSATDTPSEKEEVVYGILELDGSVESLYVVNIFNSGTVTDFGDYSDIKNMTTSDKINKDGDQITISTNADKLYYQGTLENKELPWNITIKYYLDGEEFTGKDLAGKSGKLKITMSVKQNKEVKNTFYENYALQITISLNNKLSTNISTDNATVAQAGSKKQLTYTLLPGNDIDINVTADVKDFEMEPITINGIKLSLNMDVDTYELTSQISELEKAIKGLDEGSIELLVGLNELSKGMEKYIDGMKAFKNGFVAFSMGADDLSAGTNGLRDGLSELTMQNDLLVNGALAIQQATFDSVNKQLMGIDLGLPVLTPDNYSTVLSSIPDLSSIKDQLDNSIQFSQNLKDYMDGVAQLSEGASNLAEGINEFMTSSFGIATSANNLYKAGEELNNGIKELRDGLASYQDGTEELRKGTSSMSLEMSNKIDEILRSISGKGNEVISFVSDKNTNVSAVQFVLKTKSISIPEAPKTDAPKDEELNFWQRLLRLFEL